MKKLTDVKEFTVQRSKWLRGNMNISRLLNNKGKMCCLGFYSKACGIQNEDIKNISAPEDISNNVSKNWKTRLLKFNNRVNTAKCFKLMQINDSSSINDEERERRLTKQFKILGIKVNFVGKK